MYRFSREVEARADEGPELVEDDGRADDHAAGHGELEVVREGVGRGEALHLELHVREVLFPDALVGQGEEAEELLLVRPARDRADERARRGLDDPLAELVEVLPDGHPHVGLGVRVRELLGVALGAHGALFSASGASARRGASAATPLAVPSLGGSVEVTSLVGSDGSPESASVSPSSPSSGTGSSGRCRRPSPCGRAGRGRAGSEGSSRRRRTRCRASRRTRRGRRWGARGPRRRSSPRARRRCTGRGASTRGRRRSVCPWKHSRFRRARAFGSRRCPCRGPRRGARRRCRSGSGGRRPSGAACRTTSRASSAPWAGLSDR